MNCLFLRECRMLDTATYIYVSICKESKLKIKEFIFKKF